MGLEEVEGFRLGAQGFALEDAAGVVGAEELGVLVAVAAGDEVAGLAQAWRTGGEVVGVGGDHMDPAIGEQAVAHALGFLAHVSEDGVGGDLDDHAVAEPVGEAFGVTLQRRVAFGVGEDGGHAGDAELVEGVGEGGSEAVVGELDEEIAGAVDGEL